NEACWGSCESLKLNPYFTPPNPITPTPTNEMISPAGEILFHLSKKGQSTVTQLDLSRCEEKLSKGDYLVILEFQQIRSLIVKCGSGQRPGWSDDGFSQISNLTNLTHLKMGYLGLRSVNSLSYLHH